MDEMKLSKKARNLFIFWCVAYVFFDVASSIYVSYQQVINRVDPTAAIGGFQWVTLGTVAFFFIPTLYGIYRITKQYAPGKLRKVVGSLLIILSLWTGAMVFWIVLGLIVR